MGKVKPRPFKVLKLKQDYVDMPNPSKDEIESDEFNDIWNIIKNWDINVPSHYSGYTGANGSHVKLILDGLYPILRDKKIDKILKKDE